MLISTGRLLDTLVHEFQKLLPSLADSGTDGSAAQAVAIGLRLLQAQQAGGDGAIRVQLQRLSAVLDAIAPVLGGAEDQIADCRRLVIADTDATAEALESRLRAAIKSVQALIVQCNQAVLSPAGRADVIAHLVAWETQDLLGQLPDRPPSAASTTEITRERLAVYLRDRFSAPDIAVTHIQPLAGGFGKETIFFSAHGGGLAGDFVLRREMAGDAALANDCHAIADEYAVVRAAYAHGFPAPEALWLDTEHDLLPGGHFVVMRRSPGRVGGSVFAAQATVPDDLADVLAEQMARLHTMQALRALGDLTDSIRADLWDMPLAVCIRRYIGDWYAFYLAEDHTPSPSIVALFGWLLQNVPDREGKPCFLHGDIGFHNFLFHEGRMSALLDWEFAHIGDAAEDLGYVKVTVGHALDWKRFISRYEQAGGHHVDERTMHFFQIWASVRNAAAANVVFTRLCTGRTDDLKLSVLPYLHIPHFIAAAQRLVASYPI